MCMGAWVYVCMCVCTCAFAPNTQVNLTYTLVHVRNYCTLTHKDILVYDELCLLS